MKKVNKMKIGISLLLGIGLSYFNVLPGAGLYICLFAVLALDFGTGVYKAWALKEVRTSTGFRRTVNKFVVYGAAIVVSNILVFIATQKGGEGIKIVLDYLGDALLVFLIYIETTSIFENLYKVDSKSKISKYFFAPMLKILTFQVNNNPLTNIAKELNANDEKKV